MIKSNMYYNEIDVDKEMIKGDIIYLATLLELMRSDWNEERKEMLILLNEVNDYAIDYESKSLKHIINRISLYLEGK
jgi:hypothetical protein